METVGFNKHTPVVIDNNFPLILVQTTEALAGEYFIGNMSEGFDTILFRQFENMNNTLQAYFPMTDCADVAIQFKEKSL